MTALCPRCEGTGWIEEFLDPCPDCIEGAGFAWQRREAELEEVYRQVQEQKRLQDERLHQLYCDIAGPNPRTPGERVAATLAEVLGR